MDSEPITQKDDFSDLLVNMNKQFSYKIAALLFIFYLIINSDIFIENVLGGISSSLHVASDPTDMGVIVQGIFITLAYIGLSIMRENL